MCLFYNQLLLILVLISRIVRIDMKTLLLAPFARLKKKILWVFFLGGVGICAHRHKYPTPLIALHSNCHHS